MKPASALLALFSACLLAHGQTGKPLLLDRPLPLIDAPDLRKPLAAPFATVKGTWTPEDGVLHVLNIPREKHIPVLHHRVGLAEASIEVEFRFDGPGSFLATSKSRSWLAATPTVQVRRLRISGRASPAQP